MLLLMKSVSHNRPLYCNYFKFTGLQLFTKEKKLKYEKGLGREKVHKNALVDTQSPWLQGGAYRPIQKAVFSPLQIVSCLSLLILVGYIYTSYLYLQKYKILLTTRNGLQCHL